jgi:outer membrane protein TolC
MEWRRSFASLVVLALVVLAQVFGARPLSAQSQEPAQTEQPSQAPPAKPAPGMGVTTSDNITHMGLFRYDFTKGNPALPNIFKPYTAFAVPQHIQENLPALDQYMRNGKLVLSLQDAIELALRNNLDISVQRWVTYQSDSAVLSAKSGPGFLTPTGPFVTFDPILSSTAGWQRTTFPINNPLSSGSGSAAASSLTSQATVANFSYQQAFPTGSAFNVSLNTTRSSSTSEFNLFNPAVTSTLTVVFQQPLLQGFGYAPNLRFLRVARNNRKVADLAFEQQVITSVVAVLDQYYELVFSLQDVGVKEKSLALNEKLYNDNKRQVEIGTLAPIEITRAAAAVASSKGDLINSRTLALQNETLLKNLLFRNVMASNIAELSIVPTDKPDETMQVPDITLEDAVTEAKQNRPDVKQAIINLDSSKIVVKATHNLLLPSLSLNAQYGSQGLGGDACLTPAAPPTPGLVTCNPPAPQPFPPGDTRVPGGLHDALAQVFQSNFPNYSVFLSFQMPIRNRLNQAQDITARLQQRQNEAALQRTQNTVAVDVRNAQITLTQDKAAVDTAIQSRILAEQTLDAEQKKFLLGATTTYNVVLTERDLATARSVEVRALANLAEAKVNFDRALGRTLGVNRIDVADARHAGSGRIPLIPGTPSSESSKSARAE